MHTDMIPIALDSGNCQEKNNMNIKQFKTISFTLAFFTFAIGAGAALRVSAGTIDSISGWLWSGSESISDAVINGNETGLGWISMNSSDCDTDGNGTIDTASCGTVGSPIANYGVNVPSSNGTLSGYAWSEHFGWISFNATACHMVSQYRQRGPSHCHFVTI
jgi:hypothetical protein